MHRKRYREEGKGLFGSGTARWGRARRFGCMRFSCVTLQVWQARWVVHAWVGLQLLVSLCTLEWSVYAPS